ncbi:Hin recombinase [Variovorax sp. LjRoot84]|uniref:helix-turn-helix domain-containing protein n=1 Tax=Variovorax sp. LjRoot84 TaxID=3342340 RepID=UPI003ED10C4F
MGRPSKLTDAQWAEIGKRLLNREKAAKLAREFGVSSALISQRFSKTNEKVKSVANQLVTTEKALEDLSVPEQLAAVSLARKLRATLEHMAGAAEYGAATAQKLLGMANVQAMKIDDVDPLKSIDVLRSIGALTKLANDSAVVPSALISGSKEAVKQAQKETPVTPVRIVVQVEDASQPEAQ